MLVDAIVHTHLLKKVVVHREQMVALTLKIHSWSSLTMYSLLWYFRGTC